MTGNAVEIGVREGAFAEKQMRVWAPKADKNSIYYMIDAWQQRTGDLGVDAKKFPTAARDLNDGNDNHLRRMKEAEGRVSKFPGQYKLIREFSLEAANQFPDEYFDYMYIDALHTYEAVIADLNAWWPKLKKGGIMAGDDFGDWSDPRDGRTANLYQWGVRRAVKEFAANNQLPFFVTYRLDCYADPAWYTVKV